MAMTRHEFQTLARMRLQDARVLMRSGNFEAAYYLTGLAVECALKACIAKNTKRYDFPPKRKTIDSIYSHELGPLINAAGLQQAFVEETSKNSSLKNSWAVVKDWNIEKRYVTKGLNGRDLYAAVAGRGGVMQWLRQRW